jgi:hypothetical protein
MGSKRNKNILVIQKYLLFIFLLTFFTSCEVYERYFIMASNRYGNANIIVKVKSLYYLPKDYITASKSTMGCNSNIDLDDGSFSQKISIKIDTTRLQYSFNLPACYTVLLQPINVGPSHIEYIIVDGRDTIATNGVNYVNYNSDYVFKKHSNQRFLLTIKAP